MTAKTTTQLKEDIKKMVSLFSESERLYDIDKVASNKLFKEGKAIENKLTNIVYNAFNGVIDRKRARAEVSHMAYEELMSR